MAVLGFLAHTSVEDSARVEKALAAMPCLTTYGVHQDCYVVAVAVAPQEQLEGLMEDVRQVEGVLTCYVTSMSTEDEE